MATPTIGRLMAEPPDPAPRQARPAPAAHGPGDRSISGSVVLLTVERLPASRYRGIFGPCHDVHLWAEEGGRHVARTRLGNEGPAGRLRHGGVAAVARGSPVVLELGHERDRRGRRRGKPRGHRRRRWWQW